MIFCQERGGLISQSPSGRAWISKLNICCGTWAPRQLLYANTGEVKYWDCISSVQLISVLPSQLYLMETSAGSTLKAAVHDRCVENSWRLTFFNSCESVLCSTNQEQISHQISRTARKKGKKIIIFYNIYFFWHFCVKKKKKDGRRYDAAVCPLQFYVHISGLGFEK